MKIRKTVVLAKTSGPPRVRHYVGLPRDLAPESDRYALPTAAVLVIEETQEGFFLTRLSEDGELAGNTWHPSLDEALEQVAYEYGETATDWMDVPDDVSNVVVFALARCPRR